MVHWLLTVVLVRQQLQQARSGFNWDDIWHYACKVMHRTECEDDNVSMLAAQQPQKQLGRHVLLQQRPANTPATMSVTNAKACCLTAV